MAVNIVPTLVAVLALGDRRNGKSGLIPHGSSTESYVRRKLVEEHGGVLDEGNRTYTFPNGKICSEEMVFLGPIEALLEVLP